MRMCVCKNQQKTWEIGVLRGLVRDMCNLGLRLI
jgi:hypothetical protein